MAKLGELFRSTEEQITPVEAVVTGETYNAFDAVINISILIIVLPLKMSL